MPKVKKSFKLRRSADMLKNKDPTSRNVVVFCNGFKDDFCDEADLVNLAMKKKFTRFFCRKRNLYAIQIIATQSTAYYIRDVLKEVRQWGRYKFPLLVGVCSWDYAKIFAAAPGWLLLLNLSFK